jgi:hypothetical protein
LNVTGNITANNVAAVNQISAGGNVVGGNVTTAGIVSATGNITSAANVSGGNVVTGGIVSSTGNVIAGNVTTAGQVSATGNVSAGNVNTNTLAGTGVTITSTGNLNLQPTGNIVLANAYINGVAYPVQDQDGASKLYVDNMTSTQIAYHSPVLVATNDTLANITGGTITYAQPNGVANGVGATLTTTGSFNLIDTANVQTAGTRILVKDQANAVQNGVYVWSNATVITRSTDADEYGPNSAEQFSINDYFFVQSGNVNAGSAWVVNSPTGTITFGTSNITFAQFSSSQTYSANTSAGIVFNGTVISAKTDNITTSFDGGGNIVVKPSAQLTTPNIGAATGTTLSLTGTATVGNLDTGGTVSATGNITGGNINTSQLSLSGNVISVLNVSANAAATNFNTTGLLSASGNVIGGNVSTGGLITATGNVTGGNINTVGIVSATGNITGGNIIVIGTTNSTSTTTGAITVSGGVGITGNLYVGANAYAGGFQVLTTNSVIDGGTF